MKPILENEVDATRSARSITQMDVINKTMTWVHLVKGPLEHVIYICEIRIFSMNYSTYQKFVSGENLTLTKVPLWIFMLYK